jgi:surfeit locus 1 family protein
MAPERMSACFLRLLRTQKSPISKTLPKWPQLNSSTTRSAPRRPISSTPRRPRQAADDPGFTSILDNPPELVRTGRKHGPGLIILGKQCSITPIPLPTHH